MGFFIFSLSLYICVPFFEGSFKDLYQKEFNQDNVKGLSLAGIDKRG